MKTIRKEIEKCRRGEHLTSRKYRRWLRFFVKDKFINIEKYLLEFAEGTLTRAELETLLSSQNAQRLIGTKKGQIYLDKFDDATLSESDVEQILDNVFAIHFTINEMIEGATGVTRLDGYDVFKKEYGRAGAFLSKDRKLLEHLLNVFWTPDEIEKRKTAGWTDEQMVDEFVSVCISENLYPLINDNPIIYGSGADGYYKPLTLSMWTKQLTSRMRGIGTLIERSAKEVIALESRGIQPGLPGVNAGLQEAIASGSDPYKKVGLPAPKFDCPFDGCSHRFDTKQQLAKHLRYKHKAKAMPTSTPSIG